MNAAALRLLVVGAILAAVALGARPGLAQQPAPAVPAAGGEGAQAADGATAAGQAGATGPEEESDLERRHKKFVAEYDIFNSGISLGYAHYRDHLQDVVVDGTTVVDEQDIDSDGLSFTVDFLFVLCGGPLWVGAALDVASGTDHEHTVYGQPNIITHGAVSVQLRYNFYGSFSENYYPFLAAERGRFSQSFMVPYGGAPLRLSAAGDMGGVIVGLQRINGFFVALAYHQYTLDTFDVKLPGATKETPIFGDVSGKGIVLRAGYRWF